MLAQFVKSAATEIEAADVLDLFDAGVEYRFSYCF
jgi:hypothetical protein